MRHCSRQTSLRTHGARPQHRLRSQPPFSPAPTLVREQGGPGACAERPGPRGVHDCTCGARRAGSPQDPTRALCAPRGPGLGPCCWPSASSLPVSEPQNLISPPPGALRANSSLIICGSRLCCNVSGVPGPICVACLLGTLLSTDAWLPCSIFQALFLSPLSLSSSFRARSWLLWQHCSGYQVVVGGREPRVPQPPPFPMPGTLEAQWRGLMVRGPLGASPGLAGFSLAMGGGERGGVGMRVRV